MIELLQDKLVPFMEKISNQRHVKAIRQGLTGVEPVMFVISIALILQIPIKFSLPVGTENLWTKFLILWQNWALQNRVLISKLFQASLGFFGVFVVFSVSYKLAANYDLKEMLATEVAVINYLLVSISLSNGNVQVEYLSSSNLFTAIIVAIITVELIRLINKYLIADLKAPQGIPQGTIDSFTRLAAAVIAGFCVYSTSLILQKTTGMVLPQLIRRGLQPIVRMIDSPGGVFLFGLLAQLLWFTGIHGVAIVQAVLRPFLELNWMVNAGAYVVGEEMSQIFTMPFWNFYMLIGGSGATLILSVLCRHSRSRKLQEIGEISLVPGLFNIDESIIFASPLVLNKIMFLPFVFIQPIIGVIAYYITKAGWVGKAFIRVPWITPAPIGAFLSTLDWKAPVLVVGLAFLSGAMYYPFFKIFEQKLIQQEEN